MLHHEVNFFPKTGYGSTTFFLRNPFLIRGQIRVLRKNYIRLRTAGVVLQISTNMPN